MYAINSHGRQRLVVLDCHNVAYRAFFVFKNLRTRAGFPSGAIHGFFSMLGTVLEQRPEHIVATFDVGGHSARRQMFAGYKAQRKPMEGDLRVQLTPIQDGLEALGIPLALVPDHEADDVIGTLARQGEEAGFHVTIVSGDKDLFQLVTAHVNQLYPKGGLRNALMLKPDDVEREMGVRPEHVVDFKALAGDNSDCIPGVRNIGEKTALALIREYGSLEQIYAALPGMAPGRVASALAEGRESGFLSKTLATINRDVPVTLPTDRSWIEYDQARMLRFCDQYELDAIARRLPRPGTYATPPATVPTREVVPEAQMSLGLAL